MAGKIQGQSIRGAEAQRAAEVRPAPIRDQGELSVVWRTVEMVERHDGRSDGVGMLKDLAGHLGGGFQGAFKNSPASCPHRFDDAGEHDGVALNEGCARPPDAAQAPTHHRGWGRFFQQCGGERSAQCRGAAAPKPGPSACHLLEKPVDPVIARTWNRMILSGERSPSCPRACPRG